MVWISKLHTTPLSIANNKTLNTINKITWTFVIISAVNEGMEGSCSVNGQPCSLLTIGSNKYYKWSSQPLTSVFNLNDAGDNIFSL